MKFLLMKMVTWILFVPKTVESGETRKMFYNINDSLLLKIKWINK